MVKGPEGTWDVWRSASLMKSSTVLGALAWPVSVGMGCVTNPGDSAKLRSTCTPPKYTWRPQFPGRVLLSPSRNVVSRSGKSRVKVVSSRRKLRRAKVSSPLRLRPTELVVSTPKPFEMPSSVSAPKSVDDGIPRAAVCV